MTPTLDIHRLSDGSIDFNFYRARAARMRAARLQRFVLAWKDLARAITVVAEAVGGLLLPLTAAAKAEQTQAAAPR